MISYYIYYNPDDFTIVSITPIEEKTDLPFVVVDSEAGQVFMDGRCSMVDYIVDPHLISTGFPFVKKSASKVAIVSSDGFEMLRDLLSTNNCITVTPKTIEVELDRTDHDAMRLISELIRQNCGFILYITQKNLPDNFVEEVTVDAQQLFDTCKLSIERVSSIVNVSVFSNYVAQIFRIEALHES